MDFKSSDVVRFDVGGPSFNLHAISVQNFTEEQQIKIKHRCRYVRKQKVLDPCNTSKDDLDLLGDDVETF